MITAFVTDAFGGFGGIAQYNRDFLTAVALHEAVEKVLVLPRLAGQELGPLPPKLLQRSDCLGGVVRYAKACAGIVGSERPRMVLCGHVNLLPFAAPIARRFRVPLVMLVYGIEVWKPPRLASRVLLSQVDRVVSISQVTVDKAVEWSAALASKPFTLIPNAVDLAQYGPRLKKSVALLDRYQLHGRRVIMTLARLAARERYKGVDEVLEIMPSLLQRVPDLAYLVVGDGSDANRLKAKANASGLTSRVVFAGRIADEERAEHYRLADAFVMPGRGEGFGFVFLEALASGIPVVASILDGSREAVRLGELGQLCDPRDLTSVIEATMRALAQPRGIVPEGLRYFSVENFNRRVHDFLSPYV